jgi:hypothetical protein
VTGQNEHAHDEQPEAVAPDGPESPDAPESPDRPEAHDEQGGPVVAAAPARRRRRFPVGIVATAVSLALVAGAGAWGRSVLKDADRTAPTTIWAEPAEHPELDFPPLEPTGLAAQLLPVPRFWVLGPDVDEHGNDSVIGAQRAVALLKQGSRGLPGAQRKQHDKAVEKLRIKGLAMRSYRPSSGSEYLVETRLTQLENTKAVGDLAAFRKSVADALGVFRKGPRVEGHPKARCHLMPEAEDIDLDGMMCTGHVGEVLVTTYAYGTKPLPTRTIADMVRDQLDHIASPGESV